MHLRPLIHDVLGAWRLSMEFDLLNKQASKYKEEALQGNCKLSPPTAKFLLSGISGFFWPKSPS